MDDHIRKPVRLEEPVVLLSTRPRPPTINLPAGNQRADRGRALDTEVFAAFMAASANRTRRQMPRSSPRTSPAWTPSCGSSAKRFPPSMARAPRERRTP
jgi:hypothetical protein